MKAFWLTTVVFLTVLSPVPVAAALDRGVAERMVIYCAYAAETQLQMHSPGWKMTVAPECRGATGGRCSFSELMVHIWQGEGGNAERPTELRALDDRIAQQLQGGHIGDVTFDEWRHAAESAYFNSQRRSTLGANYNPRKDLGVQPPPGEPRVIEQKKILAYGQSAAALVMALRRYDQDFWRNKFFTENQALNDYVRGRFEFEWVDGKHKWRSLLPESERSWDHVNLNGLTQADLAAMTEAERYGQLSFDFIDFAATIEKYKGLGFEDIASRLQQTENAYMEADNGQGNRHQAAIDAAAEVMEGCSCAGLERDFGIPIKK